MRFFLDISYNGKNYFGWQIQPNIKTVQQTIENRLSILLRQEIKVVSAGRTDTGVHAKQMILHFDYSELLGVCFLKRLNSFLPIDICVNAIYKVVEEAHARFNAMSRTYEYVISLKKSPFNWDKTYYFRIPVNIDRMNEMCTYLMLVSDFSSFTKSNLELKNFNCNVMFAEWCYTSDCLTFTITANRFLRNMVRAIVGTMLELGSGKITLDDVKKIIASKNRSLAGASVPAKGLYLLRIKYPKDIYI